jgi:hypothetical protein
MEGTPEIVARLVRLARNKSFGRPLVCLVAVAPAGRYGTLVDTLSPTLRQHATRNAWSVHFASRAV